MPAGAKRHFLEAFVSLLLLALPPPAAAQSAQAGAAQAGAAQAGAAQAAQAMASTADGAEDLILELRVENYELFDAFAALTRSNRVFLPVSALADGLEFYQEVTLERGLVDGWFIEPSRRFSISLEEGVARGNGQEIELGPRDAFVAFDDVYVVSDVLARIWPVAFVYEPNRLLLWIRPEETLPVQARLEREERRKRLLRGGAGREDYPRREIPYEAFTTPVGDLQASTRYGNDEGLTHDYSLLLTNDLLYSTGELFVAGSEEERIGDARLRLRRVDPDSRLLGLDGLARAELGDLSTPGLNLISNPRLERGLLMSSYATAQATRFDRTVIEGDSLPGYEAELYRNNVLLDFQVVGDDGRFSFADVPLQIGRNEIVVVQYGPQGQRREETFSFFVGPELTRPGDLAWTASLSQANRNLFMDRDSNTGDSKGPSLENPQGPAGSVEATYGLLEGLSFYAGAARVPQNDRPRSGAGDDSRLAEYGTLGLRASAFGTYWRGDVLTDASGGRAAEASAQTQLGSVNLTASHAEMNDFESDVVGYRDSALVRRSEARLDTYLSSGFLSFLPAGAFLQFSGRREEQKGGQSELGLNQRFSFRLAELFFDSELDFRRLENDGGGDQRLRGILTTSGYLDQIFLRGQIAYKAAPTMSLESSALTAEYDWDERTHLRGTLRQSFGEEGETTFSASVSRDFDSFRLGFNGEADSEGEMAVGLSLSVSLAPDPYGGVIATSRSLARSGAAAMRVYEDVDFDGRYDPAVDQPVEDARFEVQFNPEHGRRTDARGRALREGLAPYQATNIGVAAESLANPYWRSTVRGVSLVPRPGRIVPLDFPVVETGEVEGMVYLKDGARTSPLARASIEVLNAGGEVVGKTTSSYDGYYYLAELMPGAYRLRVEAAYLLGGRPFTVELPEFSIDRENLLRSGVDIVIEVGPPPS